MSSSFFRVENSQKSLGARSGESSGCGWRNGFQLCKQPQTNDKGWSSSGAGVMGVGLTTLHPKKNKFVTKNEIQPRTRMDYLDKRPQGRNMDMRFGLWNVRNLYRAGSLMKVSRELRVQTYKLDLVGVQEVRREGGGTRPAGEYTFFYEKRKENHELGTGFFVQKRIIPVIKSVESVSDRMSYIILRGHWCHIIVLKFMLQQKIKLMM
jgi:hypothetical protein